MFSADDETDKGTSALSSFFTDPVFEIEDDIISITNTRFDPLYNHSMYHHEAGIVQIILPALGIGRETKHLSSEDRIRSILSRYPDPRDLKYFKNIVFRPRFAESAGIALSALYLPETATLVVYLGHEHHENSSHLDKPPATDQTVPDEMYRDPLHQTMRHIAGHGASTPWKFFVNNDDHDRYIKLLELSWHFSRMGY